jgi:hypothetical protein
VKIAGRFKWLVLAGGGTCLVLLAGCAIFLACAGELKAGPFGRKSCRQGCSSDPAPCVGGPLLTEEPGGAWYWMRSPEQEKRVVASLYNRYCIRCHGVDGRGVWDIPDVPDFTNPRWVASRSDGQLARAILEGRGAVMPPFRGALSLEESWAMARYLRTLMPGTEMSRPDYGAPDKSAGGQQGPPAKKP